MAVKMGCKKMDFVFFIAFLKMKTLESIKGVHSAVVLLQMAKFQLI
jgi:hypothetical protein